MRKKAEIEKKTLMEGFSKLKAKGAALNRSEFQKLASKLNIPVSARLLLRLTLCRMKAACRGARFLRAGPGGR